MTSSLTSHKWMRFFVSVAEWVRFFVFFAATQTFSHFSELNFWLGEGISLLLSTGLTAWSAWTLSTVQSLK